MFVHLVHLSLSVAQSKRSDQGIAHKIAIRSFQPIAASQAHQHYITHNSFAGTEQQTHTNMAAEQQQQKPILPEEFLKVIHGQVPHEDKKQQYQESLQKYVAAAAAACA